MIGRFSNLGDRVLVYMYGGGYIVGCVDDFERGFRVVVEELGFIVSIEMIELIMDMFILYV